LEKQTTTDPPEQSDKPLVKAQIKIARPSDRIAVSYSNHNDNLLVKTNTKVCLLSSKNKKKNLEIGRAWNLLYNNEYGLSQHARNIFVDSSSPNATLNLVVIKPTPLITIAA